jgi:phage FluMu protein Com
MTVKQWLQNLMMNLNRWMYGRYGNDPLNKCLLIAAVVMAVISYFPYLQVFSLLALGLLLWANCRCFSKNIPKRQRELETYRRITNRWKTKSSLYRRMWRERKTHCYFKCAHCRAVLRVPKGKGEVHVGCPRCKGTTTRRT